MVNVFLEILDMTASSFLLAGHKTAFSQLIHKFIVASGKSKI